MIVRYLGEPIDIVTALSIDALTTLIKGGTFFVPGSIGAQEAGTLANGIWWYGRVGTRNNIPPREHGGSYVWKLPQFFLSRSVTRQR